LGTNPPTGWGRFEQGELTIAGTHTVGPIDGNSANVFQRQAGLDICAMSLPFEALGPIPLAPIMGSVTGVSNQTTLAVNVTVGSLAADFIGGEFSIGGGPWRAITGVNPGAGTVTIDSLQIPFSLIDDDATSNGMSIPALNVSGINEIYGHAFIRSIVIGDWATVIPFINNLDLSVSGYQTEILQHRNAPMSSEIF
jgi:hypothetical protein